MPAKRSYRKKRSSRRPVKRRVSRKRKVTKRSVRATAKKMALALKMTKKHEVTLTSRPFGKIVSPTPIGGGTFTLLDQAEVDRVADARQYTDANNNVIPRYDPNQQGLVEMTEWRRKRDAYAGELAAYIGKPVVPQNSHSMSVFSTRNWFVLNPLYIPATLDTNSETDREGTRIYANNTQMQLDLHFHKRTVQCCRVRTMFGYFKGTTSVVPGSFSWTELETYLPRWNSKFDPVNDIDGRFSIKYDKTTIVKPEQVYDENFSDDKVGATSEVLSYLPGLGEIFAHAANADEVANGLWRPYNRKFNFKFGRQYTYTNGDPDGLVGWAPFIAVGVFPCEHDFQCLTPTDDLVVDSDQTVPINAENAKILVQSTSDDHGIIQIDPNEMAHPPPAVSVTMQTYFKDIF